MTSWVRYWFIPDFLALSGCGWVWHHLEYILMSWFLHSFVCKFLCKLFSSCWEHFKLKVAASSFIFFASNCCHCFSLDSWERSWLLLGYLPPNGLFLHFSRIALGLCCQHQVVTFFWASRLSLLADVLRRRLLHRNGTYIPPLVVHQPRQHGLVGGWKRSLAGRFSINPDDSKG